MNFTLPTETKGFLFGDVYFYLFTRQNTDSEEELLFPKNGGKIRSKYFNESNDIRAITHGWLSSTQYWATNMKNDLLNVSDFNVILVEWSELASNPIYPWSALCTRYVGKQLYKLLCSLADSYDIKDRNIHLIGHSLGAQVMGHTGMFSKGRINRITGLDPARPLFELPNVGPRFRLDASDADFVDIIHSSDTLGYKYSQGDADFYPNGGSKQRGCEDQQYEQSETCSHSRAYIYFSESIITSNHSFRSYPCMDWATYEGGKCHSNETLMGYPANNQASGDYYLTTNDKSPYGIS
ncbi:pancreatic triacylglycerol lipase-like [Plodia interpunctella]|uniref:pancreatic triacylglycerol lipase-like n=1 Tax=Plodia interpunctella TaxID=58824 RepID=UPI003101094F